MRLLLDHCVPRKLAPHLIGHQVSTAREMEWDHLRNGALLAAAGAAGFEALVTVDQSLRYQQNPAMIAVSVLVMRAPSNDINDLIPLVPRVLAALRSLPPRRLVDVQ